MMINDDSDKSDDDKVSDSLDDKGKSVGTIHVCN